MHSQTFSRHGFTLVEISIVMIVIGLIVGAIVGGSTLLDKSRMRAVISEYQETQAAISAFKTKYSSLPGDMTDATAIWGAANAMPATCIALTNASPSQGTLTCNGNGDGVISAGYEEFRAWQHLANINGIDGRYTGVGSTTTAGAGWQAGSNVPKSAFRDAGWRIFFLDAGNKDSYELFNGVYENHFLSLWGGRDQLDVLTPTLTPQEAYELDQKIDDGLPATGNMVVRHTLTLMPAVTGIVCAVLPGTSTQATASDSTAVYNVVDTKPVCQAFFRTGF